MWNKKSPFLGKYVSVMQKTSVDGEMDFHDNLPTSKTSIPLVQEGYFLSEDKDFIYLGDRYSKKLYIGIHKNDISNIETRLLPLKENKLSYYIPGNNDDRYDN